MCGSRLKELGPWALVGSGNKVWLPQVPITAPSVLSSSAHGTQTAQIPSETHWGLALSHQ